ncbi:hypothetical protein FISHEDRAFT_56486 [Fistulina hepatica ATCC 64428]|uniref:Uncharacterized protein n=1 Tax=Fistulina hepatica ATCC 64428 TaxID=1128425 RepID=A0A0D7AIY5_9AGAR|nr:hypothetical protein FISHEDRAFT_56486 [Fistulina hepatica ATCC 64428]
MASSSSNLPPFDLNGHRLKLQELLASPLVQEYYATGNYMPHDLAKEIGRLGALSVGATPVDIDTLPVLPVGSDLYKYDPPAGAETHQVTVTIDGHEVHFLFWKSPLGYVGVFPHYHFKWWCDSHGFQYHVREANEMLGELLEITFPTISLAGKLFVLNHRLSMSSMVEVPIPNF